MVFDPTARKFNRGSPPAAMPAVERPEPPLKDPAPMTPPPQPALLQDHEGNAVVNPAVTHKQVPRAPVPLPPRSRRF
jgi:hypothetical protein